MGMRLSSVYEKNSEHTIEPATDNRIIVCATMIVYKGTREEYV